MLNIKKNLNICNIYIFLWIMYVQQGLLYPAGSIISQSIILSLLLISLWNFRVVQRSCSLPPCLKGLNMLLVLFTLYGIIFVIFRSEPVLAGYTTLTGFDFLKRIYASLLPVYSIFLYTLQGKLNRNTLIFWIIIFLFSAYGEYVVNVRKNLEYLASLGSSREEFTNNTGYLFLALMPSLYIFRKTLHQYMVLLIIVFFSLSAMKRGAILGVGLAAVLFIYTTLKESKASKKIGVLVFSVLAIFLVTSYVQDMMVNSDYFMVRVMATMEGDSSGRDDLYDKLLNAFISEDNVLYVLFGRGVYGTVDIIGNLAHNDWLEIITCQGVVGICFFFVFWFYYYKSFCDLPEHNVYRFVIMMCFFVMLYKTVFSMSYDNTPIYLSTVLGFALANSKEKYVYEND